MNVWQTSYNAWARVGAGDLVFLKRRGSVEDIVAYGTIFCRFPACASTAWNRYGFGNGAADKGELQEQVARRRTGPASADPIIGNVIIQDLVGFWDRPFKLQQQMAIQAGSHSLQPIDGPVCSEIADRLALHSRANRADEAAFSALQRQENVARINAWEDAVKAAYGWKCGISKIRARDILRVVMIQPGGPLVVSNGMLLELNLAELYDQRLIAFSIKGALLVSPDLADEDVMLYSAKAGKLLDMPKASAERPGREFVEWRLANRFRR